MSIILIDSFDGETLKAYPKSDEASGSWTPSTPGALYLMIDDNPVNDSNYITSSSGAGSDVAEFGFGTLVTPTSYLKVRIRHIAGDGS